MKYKKILVSIVFLLLGFKELYAQESSVSTGGVATGTGGTSSYSAGQIFFTNNTGTAGSVAQGVQQAYEISIVLGENELTINLGLNVYPNPTTNFLTLKVKNTTNISYQLFDIQGRIIGSKKVIDNTTTVEMENLPTAIYFLRVFENNQVVKIFKIIKK